MLFLSYRIPKNSFNLQGIFTVTSKFCRTHICILSNPLFPPETQIVLLAQISLNLVKKCSPANLQLGANCQKAEGLSFLCCCSTSLQNTSLSPSPELLQATTPGSVDPDSTRPGKAEFGYLFPHSWHSLLRQQRGKSQVEILTPHCRGPHCREEQPCQVFRAGLIPE